MVPKLVVFLHHKANPIQPRYLIPKVVSEFIKKLSPIRPSRVLAGRRHYGFLGQGEGPVGDFLFFEDCSEVVHYFHVLRWVFDGRDWSRSSLVLLYWLDVLPGVASQLEWNELRFFWLLLIVIHFFKFRLQNIINYLSYHEDCNCQKFYNFSKFC